MTKIFMISIRYLLALVLVVMASACSDTKQGHLVKALPDNPENRIVVAKRYLEVMPPKELLHEVATRVAPTLAEKNRKVFVDVMNSPAMEQAAIKISLDGLVKYFTVDELNAMVAFYGSPTGKAAYKKFAPYMGEIMPQIQQEVRKAVAEANKEQEAKEPPTPKPQPEKPKQPEQKAPQPPQGKQ
jgi:hypothetical protein